MTSRHRSVFPVAALAFTCACASAPAASAPTPAPTPAVAAAAAAVPAPAAVAAPAGALRPDGRWTVALSAQGQSLDFVMELRRVDGAEFGGVVTSQFFPPMNINKATLSGNRMKISVTAPTGDEASFDIVFDGDVFTGDWTMAGDGSRVSGRRM